MERQPTEPARLSAPAIPEDETALRGTGACLRLALDAADMGWWHWDLATGQATGDSRSRQLLGLPAEVESNYEDFLSRVHPEDRGRLQQQVAEVKVRPGDYQSEFRVIDSGGKMRWVLAKGRSIAGPGGDPVELMGVLMDTTERKQAEEELQQERNLLRTLIDQLPLCVYVKNTEGRFIAANAATARIMGAASPGDLLGKSDGDFYPERSAEEYRGDELAILRGEKVLIDKSEPHIDPNGARRDILTTKIPFTDIHGKTVGLVGVSRDITDEKRAREELAQAKAAAEAASEAKSRFLANMSHEIRTPMTAVLGFAELLAEADCSEKERSDYVATIQESGKALLQLIDDVLDLAKIEAGRIALAPVDCSPRRVVDEVAGLLRVAARRKRLALEVRYVEPLPESIHTDPVRLRQILVNFVGNAIKFTEQGEVRVQVSSSDGPRGARIHFAVTDTGIGIRSEHLADIFRPFNQADSSMSRQVGGAGLGLTISRRLAQMRGGEIVVESSPGKGSTFVLSIDAGESAPAAVVPEDSRTAAEAWSGAGKPTSLAGRVLLVEDTPANRHLIQTMLRKAGATVEVAENGEEACRKAEASAAAGKPYDLILMDIQMPEMDGHEAVTRLRGQGWRGPIVALTAYAMNGDREKCLASGCDGYLPKPISRESLLETVGRHLRKG
jgi:PAS domain S-box-containing protein